MADDKSTSSTGAPADSPEFQFPRFLLQRNDKLSPDEPFFGDLPGLRRSNGWEWDTSLLRDNPDREISVGTEFAAHYVKLLKDSGDRPVGNVLGWDLVPILTKAPRGVQIGFYSAIEQLLTEYSPEPFETIKVYERDYESDREQDCEHESLNVVDSGTSRRPESIPDELLQQSGMEWRSHGYPVDGLYDLAHRIETIAKMLALSVSTGKLEVPDGLTAVVAMREVVDTALGFSQHLELQNTTVACEAFRAFVIDMYQVFSEVESRLPNSVEQATADKAAELAAAMVKALDSHTGIDRMKAVA